MKISDLQLHLRGASKPVTFTIATDERERWIEAHQPEDECIRFSEYRSVDHRSFFVNNRHIVAARLLNDQMLEISNDYDAVWTHRDQPDPTTGEYAPELWRFCFWVSGCSEPFEVEGLDELDYVTISCALLNLEHEGRSYLTVVDEDNEPISIRVEDVMLAEGFDYLNYELKEQVMP
ncbi:MAG: hypothetical protein EBY09_16775, partial [Verrucomicrobia bacterium]|nr:hypothetical protein [Verrucomicrobiota bacterium]